MNTVISILIVALATITGDQPYSIRVENPTEALYTMCRNDENCMDIETLDQTVHQSLTEAGCYMHVTKDDRYWVVINPTPDCLLIAYPRGEK